MAILHDRHASRIKMGSSTNLGPVGNAMPAVRLSPGGLVQDPGTHESVAVPSPAEPEYEGDRVPAAPDEVVGGCATTTANKGN
jgi:hypothetical protein